MWDYAYVRLIRYALWPFLIAEEYAVGLEQTDRCIKCVTTAVAANITIISGYVQCIEWQECHPKLVGHPIVYSPT
jgi:hypothetical protein